METESYKPRQERFYPSSCRGYHRQSPQLLTREDNSQISPAEHLRLALEEFGPTFIKLGQILSTRPDIAKAQRPDILATIESDLEILYRGRYR